METLNAYGDKLNRVIVKYPTIDGYLVQLEKKTNVKKIYMIYGEYENLLILNYPLTRPDLGSCSVIFFKASLC